MATVYDTTICPKCGNEECFKTTDSRIIEQRIFCDSCGYSCVHRAKRDSNGKLLVVDPNKEDLYAFSNLIIETIVSENKQ
jgi:predicted nucleic-acid-binding Zn-ribbon protein